MNPPAIGGGTCPPGYVLQGLSISGEFKKYSLVKRRWQEIEYGHVAAETIRNFSPDIVISSNAPADAQGIIQRVCNRNDIPFVFWLQDIISAAISQILPKKLPVLGHLVGAFYRWKEARILRGSSAVVAITRHFLPICADMGVPEERCHVIENWAPLGEIEPATRPTAWAKEQGLSDKKVILYSGTLGFKHNPSLFIDLARHFADQPDVRIVVITEGIGGQWLAERKSADRLDNLILLPYQPYSRLSEVLATGDIVMAILEETASIFSVPSKVLSYLCAGRPILLSVPLINLAAETVIVAKAGRAVPPNDTTRLINTAEEMLGSQVLRDECAANARAYAVRNFDIERICDKFESILLQAAGEPAKASETATSALARRVSH
jgi:glycosyltransferase involved in cell wall biosynthesis